MRRTAPWVLSLLFLALVACGGRGGAVSKAPLGGLPAKEVSGGGGEAAARRPESAIAWVHVENLLAWGLLFGLDPAKAAESDTLKSAGEILSVLDLSRPADAAASMSDGDETADWAAVVPIQDTSRFLQIARKEYDVAEKKSRYTLTKKKQPKPDGDGDPSDPSAAPKPDDGAEKPKAKDKELVCELYEKPAPTAVCGSPRGLADLAPWLRTGPKLPGVDMSVEVYMRPMRRSVHKALAKSADAKARAADASATPPSEDDKKSSAALEAALDDFEKLTLGLEAKGKEVHFSTRATFRSAQSEWTKHLFASTSPAGDPEILYRLTEGSSAAFYSAGGGPLVKLLGSMDWFDKLPEGDKPRAKAAQAQAVALLERPWAAGYGVDVAAVKKVLAEHKTTSDGAAWQKSLSKAIDGYAFFALTTDVAAFEKLAKELVRVADLDAKQPPKAAPGAPSPAPPIARPPPAQKAFRSAPAALGLPKGSFFVDETKEVVDGPAFDPKTHKPNTKKVRRTTPTMLAVGEGAQTFVVAGLDDDKAYAGAAKRILARKPQAREMDPYFRQPGLVLGGEVTTLIGAFASHEIGMAFKPSMSADDRDKLVADLEGDLAQRLVIPFALAVERRGAGGVLSFDVRGEAAAFRTLGEHAAAGLGLAALFLLLPVMGMFGGP